MPSYITLITNTGLAKISAAITGGASITMSEMGVGDGGGVPVVPDQNQTALVNEVYRDAVNQVTINTDGDLVSELIIPQTAGGFTVREIALYDSDGDLFAVGSTPVIDKPSISENAAAELVIRLIVAISNSSVINITTGGAIIATRDWVEANFDSGVQLSGGTTGQVLAKASNVDGDTEWVDPTNVNIFVNTIEEEQTLTTSQTVVTLSTVTTEALAVYIDGVRLPQSQWTADTATQLTLATSYPDGTKILMTQNEPNAQIETVKVGQIIMLGLAADPAALFGYGTWSRIAEGQAVFGYNAADTDFNTLGKTGGAKTHTHTGSTETAGSHSHGSTTGSAGSHNHGSTTGYTVLTLAHLPEHMHTYRDRYWIESAHSSSPATYKENAPTDYNLGVGAGDTDGDNTVFSYIDKHTGTVGSNQGHLHAIPPEGAHSHTVSSDGTHIHSFTTGAQAHLPPYYTVALWQRTA